jgi:hypothetical protein
MPQSKRTRGEDALQAADSYAIDAAALVSAHSADGRGVVHLDTGRICRLNAMGSEIWTLLEGGLTLSEIVDELATECDASRTQIEQDVRAFVRGLEERGFERARGVRPSS